MKRVSLITSIMLVATPSAFAQSNEEILETLRTSITETYLEQLPKDLPESFRNSGLSPSDKERLVQQLANNGAACFVDAVVEYAALYEIPISNFVSSEGTIHFDGDSATEFEQLLAPCILAARQAAGLSK